MLLLKEKACKTLLLSWSDFFYQWNIICTPHIIFYNLRNKNLDNLNNLIILDLGWVLKISCDFFLFDFVQKLSFLSISWSEFITRKWIMWGLLTFTFICVIKGCFSIVCVVLNQNIYLRVITCNFHEKDFRGYSWSKIFFA